MLRNAATLYIADYEDTPIAVAFVFDSKDTRTYAHAAADDTYRKLNAGTAIVGQMILDAKTAGLQFVDLYGIADSDDPHHPWAGFTKFKKSFGGEPITYPGAWDLPLRPLQYWTYRVYQSLRKKLR
jgi:lipid II:glycine glycyltransferase (peptidoglycan interpeptide bridge formation enzyme)